MISSGTIAFMASRERGGGLDLPAGYILGTLGIGGLKRSAAAGLIEIKVRQLLMPWSDSMMACAVAGHFRIGRYSSPRRIATSRRA